MCHSNTFQVEIGTNLNGESLSKVPYGEEEMENYCNKILSEDY
jgi:hypothetical protein